MGKWVKRIIKIIVILLCLLLVWRVLLLEDTSIFEDYEPTAASSERYNADGGLEILTHDVVHEMSEGGYFSVYSVYYAPEIKELQVTVRINDNSTKPLGDICFFGYTVDTSGEPVAEDTEGVIEGVRLHEGYPVTDIYTPEVKGEDSKLFYKYKKLIFSGVEIGESTNMIISLCSDGSVDNEHAVIVAHFAEQPFENYKLSGKEKKALESYKADK